MTVPAGRYTIKPIDQGEEVLDLQGGGVAALFDTERTSSRASKTAVVFNRDGDKYVLKTAWVEGSDVGYATRTTLGERHALSHASPPSEHPVSAQKTSKAGR
jgi:hypothetical protein